MREALLSTTLSLACLAAGAQAQDAGGIEYFVSQPVHDSLAAHLRSRQQARPEQRFFLLWRVYAADERGLSVIEAPGVPCESAHVAATARFLRIGSEQLPIISADDGTFGVRAWVPDPLDPSQERPIRCNVLNEWSYTVRFHLSGWLLSAGYEGIVPE